MALFLADFFLNQQPGSTVRCEFDANDPNVSGYVNFVPGQIQLNLTAKSSAFSSSISWHIHTFTVYPTQNCNSAGGHYNPMTNFGELSTDYGDLPSLSIGQNYATTFNTKGYYDSYINSTSIAGRSVMLHDRSGPFINGNYPRYAACNIGYYQSQTPLSPTTVAPSPTSSTSASQTLQICFVLSFVCYFIAFVLF